MSTFTRRALLGATGSIAAAGLVAAHAAKAAPTVDRTAWDQAVRNYSNARALTVEMGLQHDAAEKLAGEGGSDKRAAFDKIEAGYWRQIDAQEEAGNAVLRTPAPDVAGLAIKLFVVQVEYDNRLEDWVAAALLADLRSIGGETAA
jgi:hypothetical protein